MKKMGRVIVALMLLALFLVSCSHYVCPAYAVEDNAEQVDEQHS